MLPLHTPPHIPRMASLLNFFPCRVSRGARSYTSGLILILTLAFLLFPSPSSASTIIGLPGNYLTLSSGLVGYWPFDGKTINWANGQVADLSGQGNTGTLNNFSQTTSPAIGKIGQALKFNGSSSYISQSNSLAKGQTNLTVSAWVKPAAAADYSVIYFEPTAGGVGQSRVALFLMAARTIEFGGRVAAQEPTGAFTGQLTTGTVSLNKWTHVVGVWNTNANTISIYFNGVLQSITAVGAGTPGAFATTNPNASFPQRIGYDGGDAVFNGLIDDVRIYNRALSASEVQELYNTGAANAAHSNTTALSSGLVGYWPLDGNTTPWTSATAATTNDLSGQGNTGQLINMNQATSPVIGKIGQALKFNGTSQYINFGHASGLNLSTAITISLWMKTSVGVLSFLLTKGSGTNGFEIAVGPSNFVYFEIRNGATAYFPTISFNYSDTKWHHFLETYDSSTGKVIGYIDGTFQASATGATMGATPTDDLYIGKRGTYPTPYYFTGSIDDMRIYNRALSASEVQALYRMGRVRL